MHSIIRSALALAAIAVVITGLGAGCGLDAGGLSGEAVNEDEHAAQGERSSLAHYIRPQQLEEAIEGRHDALVAANPGLTAEYFAEPITSIEITADTGRRQLWTGDVGDGAIYAHPRRSNGEPHLVYGEIYELWSQRGAERWIGYPLEEEHDAGWGCEKDGALREQAFTAAIAAPGYHRVLCWAPGRVWTFEWLDEGAAIQRLPPVERGP
jgi:hypothetical protein